MLPFLRELGRPCRFHRARRLEIPPTNSRLIHGSASGAEGGRTTDATMVSPSEGNEARRNGRQGVAAPHSTVEAGEPTRGTPSREGGAVSWAVEGKPGRDTRAVH